MMKKGKRMSANPLTQAEANALIKMKKNLLNNAIKWPVMGGEIEVLLQSQNKNEDFVLNYWRGSINLSKRNHHLRKQTIGLVRLDIGHPHRNPDGKEVGLKHLHLYREGYNNLQWAYEIPETDFSNLNDISKTIEDFLKFIHVINIPMDLQRGLDEQ